MKSLFFNYDLNIAQTYIIRLENNSTSVRLAERCAKSCENIGQLYQFWEAYDGTGAEIMIPSHHNDIMKLIKITDHYCTKGEIATALSHISLWAQCVLLDKPIVILEHDAVMIKPYNMHLVYNSIAYLGGAEQKFKNWPVYATPPHASEGPNYHFICRAHAYSIDPAIAKNLLAYVIQNGISAPLDIMMRADLFSFHQMDLYAYDISEDDNTTISNRPLQGRTTKRNDKLEW